MKCRVWVGFLTRLCHTTYGYGYRTTVQLRLRLGITEMGTLKLMTNPPPTPVVVLSSPDGTATLPAQPFLFETVRRTVLQLEHTALLQQLHHHPLVSTDSLAAMQQLMEIIRSLRSMAQSVSGTTAPTRTLPLDQSPEALVPYVSEEAYAVLDALMVDWGNKQGTTISPINPITTDIASSPRLDMPQPPPTSLCIEDLIPSLLWAVARSDYTVMQLIEGIRGRHHQPDRGWVVGIVRLVVMLTIKTPITDWCFDLVTGEPPQQLLDPAAIVQSDEPMLPSPDGQSSVHHHQQRLIEQIKAITPAMLPFWDGIAATLLVPHQAWQAGYVSLQVGFEFTVDATAYATDRFPKATMEPALMDLVEAELLDDDRLDDCPLDDRTIAHAAPQPTTSAPSPHYVSLIERPRNQLGDATLIRLTDPETAERLTQAIQQQPLAGAIAGLQQRLLTQTPDRQLLDIVQTAHTLMHQLAAWESSPSSLVQPELLMDELLPKLLWHITRSSYDVVRWIGGIPARVLQPNLNWQQGTIRLLTVVHITAPGMDCTLDLVTAQPVPPEFAEAPIALDPDAVCQSTTPLITHPNLTVLPQQPLAVKTLMASLLQQIHSAAPTISLLTNRTAIDCLEANQDWQSGTMQLNLSLIFTPDLYT